MSHPFDGAAIAVRAYQCLKNNSMSSLPIDPSELARRVDILVKAKPEADEGVSGMLIRNGNNFGILYATHIKSEGFQRFSVAHELGHYFLDGHPEKIFDSRGIHKSHAGVSSQDRFEREADCFASHLLMPTRLVRPLLRSLPDSIAGISELANICKTSLTATAIRFMELSTSALAVVLHSGGRVDHCHNSDEMRQLRGWSKLRKGDRLPESVSLDLARTKATGETVKGRSTMAQWFGGNSEVDVSEESIYLRGYGKQLTLLVAHATADDEIDDDEAVSERWRPRF